MMSHTSSSSAPSRRDVTNFIKRAAGALTGRRRGPDRGDDRRVPRRNSYDVNDPKAKPWSRIGDGTVGEGLAHRDALLEAAQDLYHQGWTEMPPAAAKAARARHDALVDELNASGLPVGRPAAIRLELQQLDRDLDAAANRLRRIDLTVLKALLERLDFATGALFPSIEWIAGKAACHRNSVVGALRRLKAHGFIEWVRRTIATGNDGEFAPQREQTSNAYYFDHRRKMADRTWQRFWQVFTYKLRRLGPKRPPAAPPASEVQSLEVQSPELRAVLARVGALIPNAST